jgi:hypothetical protein
MIQIQECRSCESEHPVEELSPSGLCINCLPCTGPGSPALAASRPTPSIHHPATAQPQNGPGRQAVRDALAGFCQGKNQEKTN